MTATELADRLSKLLMLAHPPVAVSFGKDPPSANAEAVLLHPGGCFYGAPAHVGRLDTKPSDHANCSVGSYTHGLIDLEAAAAGEDTAALQAAVGSESPTSQTPRICRFDHR
jgi:uncharacterized protein (DUF169 family)